MRWVLAGALTGLAAVLIGLAISFSSPRERTRPLAPADTPEQLLESAFSAIEKGQPERLADLIHAPSPEFRAVLNRVAMLLRSVERLALALNERFPTEVASLKQEAAKGGGRGLGSLVGIAADAASRGPNNANARNPGQGAGQQAAIQTLLADPFGWANGLKQRVSAIVIAEDMAAVLVDEKPALSGLGLMLRRDQGRWWIDLPLQLPMVSKYVPQTLEEHQTLGSMVRVIDNAVIDLTKDVQDGKCRNLSDAAGLAGEKAFPPLVLCIIAYDRAMAARAAGQAQPASGAQPTSGK